jgi:hypothetical protein
MQPNALRAAALAATLLVTGCLKHEATLALDADGSGTIEVHEVIAGAEALFLWMGRESQREDGIPLDEVPSATLTPLLLGTRVDAGAPRRLRIR